MFRRKSPYTYQINLPPYAAKEIIEWFETTSANGTLCEELIWLVFEALSSSNLIAHESVNQSTVDNPTPVSTRLSVADETTPKTVRFPDSESPAPQPYPLMTTSPPDISLKESANFLDNLYDWEGSNSAMTNEEAPSAIPLGKKNRMLSV